MLSDKSVERLDNALAALEQRAGWSTPRRALHESMLSEPGPYVRRLAVQLAAAATLAVALLLLALLAPVAWRQAAYYQPPTSPAAAEIAPEPRTLGELFLSACEQTVQQLFRDLADAETDETAAAVTTAAEPDGADVLFRESVHTLEWPVGADQVLRTREQLLARYLGQCVASTEVSETVLEHWVEALTRAVRAGEAFMSGPLLRAARRPALPDAFAVPCVCVVRDGETATVHYDLGTRNVLRAADDSSMQITLPAGALHFYHAPIEGLRERVRTEPGDDEAVGLRALMLQLCAFTLAEE